MIVTMMRRAVERILILAACLVVLSGCSMLRLGYGQLDTYAAWTADEHFDLDPQQKQEFRTRFERLHEWHRREQLPDYAAFFAQIRRRLEKGLAREDVIWVIEGIRERYRASVRHVAGDAAAMLMTVTPAQLDALQRQWDKDNRRFIREYRLDRGAEEQRRERGRRTLSRIRDWVGHLDGDQEQKILAWANELPPIHAKRHEDRLRRQREFLQLMSQRGSDPRRFADRLRHWLLNWEEGRDPAFDRSFKEWERKQADFYPAVYGMLLPQQRAGLAERLQGYIEDFTQLAQRPGPQAAGSR